jgi:hypothetical protein
MRNIRIHKQDMKNDHKTCRLNLDSGILKFSDFRFQNVLNNLFRRIRVSAERLLMWFVFPSVCTHATFRERPNGFPCPFTSGMSRAVCWALTLCGLAGGYQHSRDITAQKATINIITAVRTSNLTPILTSYKICWHISGKSQPFTKSKAKFWQIRMLRCARNGVSWFEIENLLVLF